MSSPELTRLAIFRSVADAQLAKGLLDAADIDSMIRTDDAGGMYVGISGAELLVRAEDVEAARAALDDAELAEGAAPEGDEADSTD